MTPDGSFNATGEDIAFASGGESCAGWLYRPATDATVPLIVMAHGFSGVKEQGLAEIAERFRAAGFAVLVFDFRHFGASGGAPRGQLFPLDMVEDFRCAISWACHQPLVVPEGQPCVLPGAEAFAFFEAHKDSAPTWRNAITVESLEKVREFDSVSLVPMLAPTALPVVAAERDSLVPLDAVRSAAARADDAAAAGRGGPPVARVSFPARPAVVFAQPSIGDIASWQLFVPSWLPSR